ncbi:aminotransferase class V-fold PLP-dependent enzyme [Rubrobacter tropicus]|uniref:Aminotransferase class V-fold PLP-dependent enzyme n=1 Tax=Rubrobacter tropicus TaxID=2653851 RepID=A0A6G8Q6Q4_9ACTN|nr:aminotransferase class V-fold PLP-dependent enzyme [Rubrobacter tropicus]QIN82119.1 aminotransferase class V-fold PLP-dependent enzyme [Rubrobacter tropicus]
MTAIHLPREDFPALADNDFAYLNSGASGPPPRSVIDAMRGADDLCSGPAYLEGAGLFARQADANTRAREAAASLVNAGPNDVALTQNTTHGMNLGVAAIDWREGDEVVSTATEHPGCLMPLHAAARRFGVKVHLAEPPVTAEKVEAALTPQTRLIALSHVDWTNGEVLPLEEICALARDRGILTLVDGAQSVGNIPVDVPATGADMYAFTGHKWVLGPEGMGAFYVRPNLPVHSPNVGYLSLPSPYDFDKAGDYDLRPDARRFEASTMSAALAGGFAEAARGVRERGEAGFGEIRRKADLLMDLLSGLPRVTLRSPRPAHSGLVSFEIGGVEAKEAAERLLRQRFVLRYVPARVPYVRASTHLFNTGEELEGLARAVGAL